MADARQTLGTIERLTLRFEQMADLPTFEDRKRALLAKCDTAWDIAEKGRGRTTKTGNEISDPDCSAMIKCIELAARIMGVLSEAEKKIRDGEGDTRVADIDQLANLLESTKRYKVVKLVA